MHRWTQFNSNQFWIFSLQIHAPFTVEIVSNFHFPGNFYFWLQMNWFPFRKTVRIWNVSHIRSIKYMYWIWNPFLNQQQRKNVANIHKARTFNKKTQKKTNKTHRKCVRHFSLINIPMARICVNISTKHKAKINKPKCHIRIIKKYRAQRKNHETINDKQGKEKILSRKFHLHPFVQQRITRLILSWTSEHREAWANEKRTYLLLCDMPNYASPFIYTCRWMDLLFKVIVNTWSITHAMCFYIAVVVAQARSDELKLYSVEYENMRNKCQLNLFQCNFQIQRVTYGIYWDKWHYVEREKNNSNNNNFIIIIFFFKKAKWKNEFATCQIPHIESSSISLKSL